MNEPTGVSLREAIDAFHAWEANKYGDKSPLADMHVDLWIEAYILGQSDAIRTQHELAVWKAKCKATA